MPRRRSLAGFSPRTTAKILLVAFSSLSVVARLDATTVAIVLTGQNLYVGVDSIRVFALGRPAERQEEVCKIHLEDDVAMIGAGSVEMPASPATGPAFSLQGMFRQASRSWKGSLDERASIFAAAAALLLTEILQNLISAPTPKGRELFDQQLAGRPVVDFALFTVGNGSPRLAMRRLVPTIRDGKVVVDTISLPFTGFAILGAGTSFLKMSPTDRQQIFGLQGPAMVRELVLAQARETPTIVGPPINVIEIGPAGLKWIDQSPLCRGSAAATR